MIPTAYIEAYYADGSPILGNMDGQAVISAKQYKRTNAYKRAVWLLADPKRTYKRVAFYRVVTPDGRLLEEIRPCPSP